MMKIIRKIFYVLLALLIILNLVILISGKWYIYTAIENTYFKGRTGPSIDEFAAFSYREVADGENQEWAISSNYNKKSLSDTALKKIEGLLPAAFLVIKNDSILFEKYWEGYSRNSTTNSFSMAKTFVSILTGIAIDEGKIQSVDQKVGDFLDEFKKGDNQKVTIKHLLTMSSGIDFDENYVSPFAYPAAAYYGSDIRKLTLEDYKVTEEPGKVFKYLSGNTELLALVLEKATGKTLSEYASEKLWKPMGADNPAYWGVDRSDGVERAYCCFNSNARDFARFGKLYLNKGNWNGTQLVSEEYVENSITPADLNDISGKRNDKYGYSWWLVNYRSENIFYARGILGQYIIVIPQKNAVVVRLGHKRDKQKSNDHPVDIFKYIDAALEII
jgi:CubicO group peptidase (beta-lactamase class C family)